MKVCCDFGAGSIRRRPARSQHGFTLIEMMVVIAVLAIIAAIAIPQYRDYVTRAKRAEAKRALLEGAQFFERVYTASGCYLYASTAECISGSGTAVQLPVVLSRAPAEGRYSYSIAATSASQTFTLVATPCGTAGTCAAGNDTTFTDPTCGSFVLDNTGARSLSGAFTGNIATCWQR